MRTFVLCVVALWGCQGGAAGGKTSPAPGATPSPLVRAEAHGNPDQRDFTAEDYVMPELPRASVVLQDAYGGAHPVEVEVAADHVSRSRGMMWRRDLPRGKGMLFVFPQESVQSFWMRNTLIPLDMVFINEKGTIVGVVESATPRSLISRTVGKPSRYVLELPGGWASQTGLTVGSKVTLRGLENVTPR